ncbi:serine protease [bacterium]|nr:serine protease [bacterium]
MEIKSYIYPLFLINKDHIPIQFLGVAFPITPNGGMLSCKHVLEQAVLTDGNYIAIIDFKTSSVIVIKEYQISDTINYDLAFLSNTINNKHEYIPMIPVNKLIIGSKISSFGFYSIGKSISDLSRGFFSGTIVNVRHVDGVQEMVLPFPVLEGMSGSPVIHYYEGPKIAGICIGNKQQIIQVNEILEYRDTEKEYKETINRVVEFGISYPVNVIKLFLDEIGVNNYLVSDQRVEIPGLED